MKNKVLLILDWSLFVLLFVLSLGFLIWGEALQKFLSHSTSFLYYTEPFYQSPTVTICFSHMALNGSDLVYGKDFKIYYKYL